ncbi:hypothetical protein F3Y22_tig00111794pilonHSYRG00118 [Hibiscus syriacus]|uniref:Uncharacterized protein n=1 Tax=Hibiscus syriacus TaxID=106335 RepID=A0A6A2XTZ1_HIBSY|nr:hypothetical protein F3Y22_tig00111794pilonHSYRG00118 [Hibiscus syriacus]
MILLYQGISGRDAEKFPFRFFDRKGKFVEVIVPGMQQILAIIEDADLGSIDEGSTELRTKEFVLGNVLDAIVNKVMIMLKERITHPGEGLPSSLVQEMFKDVNGGMTQEGLELNMSRKLLSKMNGHVRYVRERNKCYFLVDLEIRTRKGRLNASQAEY